MDRNELFDYIKKNNLQAEVKERFGKPYNSVSSYLLNDFINVIKEADKAKEEQDNTSKSIVSSDRKTLIEYIKTNNLQGYIKENAGKNYTILPTNVLYNLCNKWNNTSKAETVETEIENSEIVQKEFVEQECTKKDCNVKDYNLNIKVDKLEKTIRAIVNILNLDTVLKNLD